MQKPPTKESEFQKAFIEQLESIFPDCIILKNDPRYIQGIPDLLLLWKNKWAMFEMKRGEDECRQPNQKYYIDVLNAMSYASFVYPENVYEVLDEVQSTFGSRR